jgi:hypothetical protein
MIFAIEVEDPFTLGTALPASLRAALPGIVARIRTALQPMDFFGLRVAQ